MKNKSVTIAKRTALNGAFLCAALMLSYLEAVLPVQLLIPIPGFKLGLANIAVILVFYYLSPVDALLVSSARVLLQSVLFGSVTSLAFSSAGALLSFASLLFCRFVLREKVGFIGISVLSASCHNAGQLLCAMLVMNTTGIVSYLPVLLIASLITGILTGTLLCVFSKYAKPLFGRYTSQIKQNP